MAKAIVVTIEPINWDSTFKFSTSANYAFEGDTSSSPSHNVVVFITQPGPTQSQVLAAIVNAVIVDAQTKFNVTLASTDVLFA